jgi:hypothetical protein
MTFDPMSIHAHAVPHIALVRTRGGRGERFSFALEEYSSSIAFDGCGVSSR